MTAAERAASRAGDLARAARLLTVRSRREATGLFAGNYRSAFRGGGLEFEDSRPYVPGDDVRCIDWNATARVGRPYVKTFREERDHTVWFALDVSASMSRGATGQSKAETAAHALMLMVTAAGRAGDRVGLVAFDAEVRARVPVSRGAAHGWRLIRTALEAFDAGAEATDLGAALRALPSRGHAVVVLLSDFRDAARLPAAPAQPTLGAQLARLGRQHDVVAAALVDPLEEALPSAGPLRIADPEQPGECLLLGSSSPRTRERYRRACAARRHLLETELRRGGADPVWLRTDRSPLFALGHFFRARAARRMRAIE